MSIEDSTLYMLPLLGTSVSAAAAPAVQTEQASTPPLNGSSEQATDEKKPQLTPSLMRDFLNACTTSLSSKFKI